MAIYSIPVDFPNKSADFSITTDSVKLARADRGFVAVALADPFTIPLDISLAAAGADARIRMHLTK